MMYKEININKVSYKILTTTIFNSRSINFFFKCAKNK